MARIQDNTWSHQEMPDNKQRRNHHVVVLPDMNFQPGLLLHLTLVHLLRQKDNSNRCMHPAHNMQVHLRFADDGRIQRHVCLHVGHARKIVQMHLQTLCAVLLNAECRPAEVHKGCILHTRHMLRSSKQLPRR